MSPIRRKLIGETGITLRFNEDHDQFTYIKEKSNRNTNQKIKL